MLLFSSWNHTCVSLVSQRIHLDASSLLLSSYNKEGAIQLEEANATSLVFTPAAAAAPSCVLKIRLFGQSKEDAVACLHTSLVLCPTLLLFVGLRATSEERGQTAVVQNPAGGYCVQREPTCHY